MRDERILELELLSRNSTDIGVKAEIDAQIAYHASRIGRFDLARNILGRIRLESAHSYPASVAIWVIIVDGVLAFFEKLDVGSSDRFRRAHALSVALGLNDLRALSAAWLAHSNFGCCQYSLMLESINDCLLFSRPVGDLASSRVGLVLASSYLYAGNLDESRVWYEAARQSAVIDSDRATLGAIMYNRAAVALARYRVDNCLSLPHALEIGVVSNAVSSASSFQVLTSNEALSQLLRMCEARLAMVENNFDSAILIFDGIRQADSGSMSGTADKFFDLEYLYCLVKLKRIDREGFLAYDINISHSINLDCDDRVVFLHELLEIYRELSIQDLQDGASQMLKEAFFAYHEDTRLLQSCLHGIVSFGSKN
jgi:hypothetical protein